MIITGTQIPEGYRRLKSMEIIECTDLAFRKTEGLWSSVHASVEDDKFLPKYMPLMIRKKKSVEESTKEKIELLMQKIGY